MLCSNEGKKHKEIIFKKNSQSTKISKNKKGPNKQVTVMCAHKWKDNQQPFGLAEWWQKNKGNCWALKKNKKEEHKQLASHHTKLLEDGLM